MRGGWMSEDGRRFRPSLRAALFTLPALIILVLLGNWQMHRLHWKRGLLQEIAAHMAAPPVNLPATPFAAETWEYRHVTVTGVFDHAHEMYLFAPGPQGGAGYQVITPLIRPEGDVVLVNRGWVPTDHKDSATRAAAQLAGQVTVAGVIRLTGKSNMFSPANRPDLGIWYVRDIASMANYIGAQRKGLKVPPVVVEADATPNPGGWPQGGNTITEIPNNHLDYALTWYGLALVLLVIYVVYHWRRD
jgi:surfeit locus 1 family protein